MAAMREATLPAVGVAGTPPATKSFAKLSPGPGRPAAEVAEHQRARILAAMIELIACKGYRALKVRDLVRLAGVSTRTFYERFTSKEDCLTQTYDAVIRRATQGVFARQAPAHDSRKRQHLIVASLMHELESEPKAAHLALVDVLDAGPAALEHVRRMERGFEVMLSESLARPPRGIEIPPLVTEGIVAGILGVARSRLLANRPPILNDLPAELAEWALCFHSEDSETLAALDDRSVWRNTALEPLSIHPNLRDGIPTSDRALILAAVADLAVNQGYAAQTVSRTCAYAGVTRRKFEAHFANLEDCFLASLELRSSEALAQITRAKTAGRTWSGGVYRAIVALSDHIASDTLLAEICLREGFALGPKIARCRQRFITSLMEQLVGSTPHNLTQRSLFSEATANAIWTLVCRYVIKDSELRGKNPAILAYVALAPTVGASAAMTAICEEQAQ